MTAGKLLAYCIIGAFGLLAVLFPVVLSVITPSPEGIHLNVVHLVVSVVGLVVVVIVVYRFGYDDGQIISEHSRGSKT